MHPKARFTARSGVEVVPVMHHPVIDKMIAHYGAEHAMNMAFSAGRHGEVTWHEWLDNVSASMYRAERVRERSYRKRRAERQSKEGM